MSVFIVCLLLTLYPGQIMKDFSRQYDLIPKKQQRNSVTCWTFREKKILSENTCHTMALYVGVC